MNVNSICISILYYANYSSCNDVELNGKHINTCHLNSPISDQVGWNKRLPQLKVERGTAQVVLCWTQWWTSHASKCERSWGEVRMLKHPAFRSHLIGSVQRSEENFPFSTLSICRPPIWLYSQTRDKLKFVRIQLKLFLLWKLFKAIADLCAGRGFNEKCGCAQWQCCRWGRGTCGSSSLPKESQ